MNIHSTRLPSRIQPQRSLTPSATAQPESAPQDSISFGLDGGDIKAAAILGGVGIVGAALGAAAGNFTGVLAGVAGAVVGASAGGSIAAHTPGEKVKTGMVLGAIGGAIAGSSFGGDAAAIAMGVVGATLPYGAIVGLAVGMST